MTAQTDRHVSTGSLPAEAVVGQLVDDARRHFRDVAEGRPSSVYPALERADPALFGICVAALTGQVLSAGDSDTEFPIMSVAKPFTFALVCDALGHDAARVSRGPMPPALAVSRTPTISGPATVIRSKIARRTPRLNSTGSVELGWAAGE